MSLKHNKINEAKSLFAYSGKEKLTLVIFKVDTLTGLIQMLGSIEKQIEYKLTRTYKDGKNIDSIKLTKVKAAFEIYDSSAIWKTPCSKCGNITCESIGHHHPTLDK